MYTTLKNLGWYNIALPISNSRTSDISITFKTTVQMLNTIWAPNFM